MRILSMADLHGRAEMLSPFKGIDVDLVAFCGDLHNLEPADQTRPAAEALARIGPHVLIVPGNMDPKEIVPDIWRRAGLKMVHRHSCQHGDCGFVGFGGMVVRDKRRLEDPNRYYYTDEDVYESLTQLYGDISDSSTRIVLAHQPPRNSKDLIYSGERTGSVGLRHFVEDFQPDLLICGHIHEDRGEAEIGSTKVVNVGEIRKGYAAIIELDDEIKVEWIEP
ncbi:MAG TPA: metallophosphoesterase family protein [Methanothrix sp.]|nr:metallophosphoesterase family protein [Methanothrix sp.]HPJ84250.1 metallophosphoesterase family protein [Methanothrix sp.]HPR66368.1 metallophosphoesterase family protein [Methanothrix sp.]